MDKYEAMCDYRMSLKEMYQFKVATRDKGVVVGITHANSFGEATANVCKDYDVVSILWMNDIGDIY